MVRKLPGYGAQNRMGKKINFAHALPAIRIVIVVKV